MNTKQIIYDTYNALQAFNQSLRDEAHYSLPREGSGQASPSSKADGLTQKVLLSVVDGDTLSHYKLRPPSEARTRKQ